MNYLVSMFNGVLVAEHNFTIYKNTKYEIEDFGVSPAIIYSYENILPVVFNGEQQGNVIKVVHGVDNYFFIFPTVVQPSATIKLNYKGKELLVSISSELNIAYEEEIILVKQVEMLSYSHHEEIGELCLIYFTGKRNYVVVLKGKEVLFANYYDECNIKENEKYFMCKQYDILNHGSVCHIKDNKCESYLVYLDNEELNLKDEFIGMVFLDCLKVGNFKYCNALLSNELKLEDENKIKTFFPDYDEYYPLSITEFVLFKKNTLAGIYKFEINSGLICNIISV